MSGGRAAAGGKVLVGRPETICQSCTYSIMVVKKGRVRVIMFLVEKKEVVLCDAKKTGLSEEHKS